MQALANTDKRNVTVFTPKEYPYNGLYECYSQLQEIYEMLRRIPPL